MLFTSLLSAAVLAAKASATIFYAGVAESGGEFGVWSANAVKGTGLPGTFGVDYKFINTAGIDVYVDTHHVNLFRIAFLLERMCPLATGLGATFSETYFAEFKAAVDYVTITKGAYCILDPHNYMRYNNPSSQPMSGSIIGDTSDVTAATQAQFAAFWGALAARFVNNEKVIFGLMNEPHDMDTNLVLSLDQAAINAIRATGAKQMILAPGNGWTGGHSWTQAYTGNSPASGTVMQMISDPLNNTGTSLLHLTHSVLNPSPYFPPIIPSADLSLKHASNASHLSSRRQANPKLLMYKHHHVGTLPRPLRIYDLNIKVEE